MTGHIVQSFDNELTQLSGLIVEMGGKAEAQLAAALSVLQNHDAQMAENIIAEDKIIDDLEKKINDVVVQILARRQPMARDLRETIAALKIATDLERIGDLAKHVAMLTADLDPSLPQPISVGIRHLGQRALKQVKNVLDAFSQRDRDKAITVWEGDQELDELYNSVIREMLNHMTDDPKMISFFPVLLFATKYIERVGDHATNIAEALIYALTGKMPIDRPKGKTNPNWLSYAKTQASNFNR